MKKFFTLFLGITLLALSSCNSVSDDPKEAANEMWDEVAQAFEEEDLMKVDKILGKYCDVYSKKSLSDRIKFFKTADDGKHAKRVKEELQSLFEDDSELVEEFLTLPNVKRFDLMGDSTMKEAQKLNLW